MTSTRKKITCLDELLSLYGQPAKASLVKELDHIAPCYQLMIEKSPFAVLCTIGNGGLDCSPRGDEPGFIRVQNSKTLLLPDRRGNNRLDSLRNLIEDPRASLLFLIPGVGETLRVNGKATIIQDTELQKSFSVNNKIPVTLIELTVEQIYFQCQKALVRSRLWEPDYKITREQLPSTGEIVKSIQSDFDAKAYDAEYPERLKKTLY